MDDDTYLKVYMGSCANLACIGFNDDAGDAACPGYGFASYMEFNVVAGATYYIVWTDMFDSDAFWWELRECAGSVVGVTYRDLNANGSRDAGEPQVDAMLTINPGGMNAYSGGDPYSFCSALGDYTITATPPQYHTVTPASQSYSVPIQGTQVVGMDFGFQPVPGIYDAAVNLWGQNAWIGNNTQLHVGYQNLGSEPMNATIAHARHASHLRVSQCYAHEHERSEHHLGPAHARPIQLRRHQCHGEHRFHRHAATSCAQLCAADLHRTGHRPGE